MRSPSTSLPPPPQKQQWPRRVKSRPMNRTRLRETTSTTYISSGHRSDARSVRSQRTNTVSTECVLYSIHTLLGAGRAASLNALFASLSRRPLTMTTTLTGCLTCPQYVRGSRLVRIEILTLNISHLSRSRGPPTFASPMSPTMANLTLSPKSSLSLSLGLPPNRSSRLGAASSSKWACFW